ncbi:hypothetical protein KAFR_0E00670 [Kazachstania africana CBS 2517]|uniref:Uncharacterized protein n=1 Tax=Kazachstania africana (strain ATCC 22294 / BCRC 22015 / CBS 2517 / CECT 1963 / NBRC 1671 / NRRL Y-8276) TaxID=1071382 RepID=H2AV21_KAZAF|nr:hypothetical protein KAFR_0E00670 [Kazachstania africana CBS 2517]CCF58221.1 hypothetical protein KAFR_0E00670 [Kazachstania africana CBS 2517]
MSESEQFKKHNGTKDQVITKPIQSNDGTGEVVVKKSTGKLKVRKGQTEEQYQEQLAHFNDVEKGPVVTDINWMDQYDNDPLKFQSESVLFNDLTVKHNRLVLTGFIHRLYYQKNYQDCYKFASMVKDKYTSLSCHKKMKKEFEELDYILTNCSRHLSNDSV